MGTLAWILGLASAGPDADRLDLDAVVAAHDAVLADPASEQGQLRWARCLASHIPALFPSPLPGLRPFYQGIGPACRTRPDFYRQLFDWLSDRVDRDDAGIFLIVWAGLRLSCLAVCGEADRPVTEAADRLAERLDRYLNRMESAWAIAPRLRGPIDEVQAIVRQALGLASGQRPAPRPTPRPMVRDRKIISRPVAPVGHVSGDALPRPAGGESGRHSRPRAPVRDLDAVLRELRDACAAAGPVEPLAVELIERATAACPEQEVHWTKTLGLFETLQLAYRRDPDGSTTRIQAFEPIANAITALFSNEPVKGWIVAHPELIEQRLEGATADLLQAIALGRPEVVSLLGRFLCRLMVDHPELAGLSELSRALPAAITQLALGDVCRDPLTAVLAGLEIPIDFEPSRANLRKAQDLLGLGHEEPAPASEEISRSDALRILVQQALLAGDRSPETCERLAAVTRALRLEPSELDEIVSQEATSIRPVVSRGRFRRRRALGALVDTVYADGLPTEGEKQTIVLSAKALSIGIEETTEIVREARKRLPPAQRSKLPAGLLPPPKSIANDLRELGGQCRARRKLALLWATAAAAAPAAPGEAGAPVVQLLARPAAWPSPTLVVYTAGDGEAVRARARGRLLEPIVVRRQGRTVVSLLNRNAGLGVFPAVDALPGDVDLFGSATLKDTLFWLVFVRLPELVVTEVRKVRQTLDATGRTAEALLALELGDDAQALEILEELTRSNPLPRLAHCRLGELAQLAGDPVLASGQFERELARFPDSPDARVGLGRLAQDRGDPAEAARAFRLALAVDHTHLGAMLGLASLASPGLGEGAVKVQEAMALLACAQSLYPGSGELKAFWRKAPAILGPDLGAQVRVTASPLRWC